MITTTEHRAQFRARLAREFPGVPLGRVEDIARRLQRYGAGAKRLEVEDSNRGLTEPEQRRLAGIYRRALEAVRELDPACGIVTGGDPRGCVLKLKVPSGAYDDWGGEGLCVPGA